MQIFEFCINNNLLLYIEICNFYEIYILIEKKLNKLFDSIGFDR